MTQRGAHHAAIWYDPGCQHRDQNQLVLCLVYLWLVCVGRYVVKKVWRRRVDRGPARAWHDHLASLGRPLPRIWVLYT